MLLVVCVYAADWEETEESFRMTKPGSQTDRVSGNIKGRRRYSSCTCNSSQGLGNFPKFIQFHQQFPKIHSILPTVSQNSFNSTYSFPKFIQFYTQFPKIHSILPTVEVDSFLFTSTKVQFQFWCMNIVPSHQLGCHSGDVQHMQRSPLRSSGLALAARGDTH